MDDLKEEFGTQMTAAMAYGKNISRSADTKVTSSGSTNDGGVIQYAGG
jgi:hypothetical protein